jgi:lantibiotic modifying enzyme
LGGIADLFVYAASVFGDKSYRSFANFIGEAGIRNHSKYGSLWPCGMTGGEMLGLMTGIAGIGQAYLRLYDDNKIPSILLPAIE